MALTLETLHLKLGMLISVRAVLCALCFAIAQPQASGGGGGGPSPGDPMPMVTGLVRMRCRDAGQNLEVSVRPWCGHPQHQQQEQQQGGSEGGPAEVPAKTGAMNAPCMQVGGGGGPVSNPPLQLRNGRFPAVLPVPRYAQSARNQA